MTSIKDFVLELQSISDNDVIDIKVPSTGKISKFKLISVKQHKNTIKCAVDGIEGSIKLSAIFNDIIKDNCLESIDFKLCDRSYIITQLRKASVGNMVKIRDVVYDLNDLPKFNFEYSNKPTIFSHQNITINISIPTLDFDSLITEKCLFDISKLQLDTSTKKMTDYVNVLLTYEIIKFVSEIQINNNIIKLSGYSVHDRKTIIDNIPLKLNNDIIDYIANYKQTEQKFFQFDENIDLTIDASFLTND
jgi:hypothetical protein